MKCVFIVLASLLLMSDVRAEEDLAFMKNLVLCGTEMGMSTDALKVAIDTKDSKVGCVVACALKKMGIMNDGKLDKDSIVNLMEKEKDHIPNYDKMRASLLKCYDEAMWWYKSGGELSECDLAEKFSSCVHEEHI